MEDIDFDEQLEQEKVEEEKKNKRKTKVDEDGTEYEWIDDKKAWFPKIDDDFIARYQMGYGSTEAASTTTPDFPEAPADINSQEYKEWYDRYCQKYYSNQGVEGQETVEPGESEAKGGEGEPVDENSDENRKEYFDYCAYYYGHEKAVEYCGYDFYSQESTEEKMGSQDEDDKGKKGKKRKSAAEPKKPEEPPAWFDVDETKNTNVYVSGLPLDTTDEEYKELMSKCGLIMADPQARGLKLKLYRDKEGNPKGDGRCCYIKVESVDLALKILDDSELRGNKIKVELAKFTMKGDFDPSKRKKKISNKDKRKFKEKQQKLFDWRPEKKDLGVGAARGNRPKNEKVVVLKNMFDPSDFEENPTLINELRDEVRGECAKFGEVKNVKMFDNHPDGVMMVYLKLAEEADDCIAALNHRWFSKRRIIAQHWDGRTKFEIEESVAERDQRLNKWEKFLDSDETPNPVAAKDTEGKAEGKGDDKGRNDTEGKGEGKGDDKGRNDIEGDAKGKDNDEDRNDTEGEANGKGVDEDRNDTEGEAKSKGDDRDSKECSEESKGQGDQVVLNTNNVTGSTNSTDASSSPGTESGAVEGQSDMVTE